AVSMPARSQAWRWRGLTASGPPRAFTSSATTARARRAARVRPSKSATVLSLRRPSRLCDRGRIGVLSATDRPSIGLPSAGNSAVVSLMTFPALLPTRISEDIFSPALLFHAPLLWSGRAAELEPRPLLRPHASTRTEVRAIRDASPRTRPTVAIRGLHRCPLAHGRVVDARRRPWSHFPPSPHTSRKLRPEARRKPRPCVWSLPLLWLQHDSAVISLMTFPALLQARIRQVIYAADVCLHAHIIGSGRATELEPRPLLRPHASTRTEVRAIRDASPRTRPT